MQRNQLRGIKRSNVPQVLRRAHGQPDLRWELQGDALRRLHLASQPTIALAASTLAAALAASTLPAAHTTTIATSALTPTITTPALAAA